ncbi:MULTISPECIES: hypothetical protein [unclassified Rhizobium]|uniref:hypothetical protein n=1 Tax=unclassified Rhizobium TaxID=2613769 RepID=UPI00381BC7A3
MHHEKLSRGVSKGAVLGGIARMAALSLTAASARLMRLTRPPRWLNSPKITSYPTKEAAFGRPFRC